MDACGIPNRANWHLDVIYGKEGETTNTDIYLCDDHMPGALWEGREQYPTQEENDAIMALTEWGGSEEWSVTEFTVTHLRD